MAGMLFPDIGGALSAGSQAGAASAQNQYLMKDRAARDEIAPLIPKALQGDREALDKIGARHPDTLMKITPLLERLDANKRAKVKEDAEYITSTGMAILNAPPEQQPQLYARVRAEAAAAGRDVSTWPTTYDPGWVKFNVDKARPVSDFFKDRGDGFDLVPPGGGGGGGSFGPPASASPDVKAKGAEYAGYLQTKHGLSPIASAGVVGGLIQESSLDPGYGFTRPGGDNGTAHGMGQWRLDRAQGLRTFAQAQGKAPTDPTTQLDYLVSEMKGGDMGAQRAYAMLQQAKTPDEATTAMMHFFRPAGYTPANPQGGHGYAQRVQYAQQVMPAGREVSTGGNAAPMPQPPAGMAVPGTPAPMPSGPPGLAQGSDMPPADASGTPIPTSDGGMVPREAMRMITPNLPPGANLGRDRKTGKFMVQEGSFVVYDDNKNPIGLYPIPKAPGADKGLFGDSLTGRALTVLRSVDPTSQEYAAAYAILSKPQVIPDGAGGQTVVQPMDLSMFPRPAFGGAGQPAPAGPTPAGGPAPTQIPGGGSVTRLPGAGKPLDNSARDELTKASGGVLELTELVKSFDPTFGGFMYGPLGEADNARKRNLPDMLGGKDEKGQAQWWQRYQQFANLERNKLFGAALTPGEAAEFNKAMINPGMKPDEITANLSRQRDVAAKALSRIVNSMVVSGYNPQAIEAATGIPVADLPSAMGGVPQGAPKPPAQPGAKSGTYMGPDNKPISWPEIEATAKNRGITPDEVVRRLGLQPTGMQ